MVAGSMDARLPLLCRCHVRAQGPNLERPGALIACCMPGQEARANLGLVRKSVAVGTWVAKRSRRKQVRRRLQQCESRIIDRAGRAEQEDSEKESCLQEHEHHFVNEGS